MPGRGVIDDPRAGQEGVGVGDGHVVQPDADHAGHGRQPLVQRAVKQKGGPGRVVVAGVWILAVAAAVAGLLPEYLPGREGGPEVAEADEVGGQEGELLAGQRAYNAFAGELLPQALRGAVVHDQVGVAQQAGGAEF